MAYFLVNAEGRRVGPYSGAELRLLRERGLIAADAPVVEGENPDVVRHVGQVTGADEAATTDAAGRWDPPPVQAPPAAAPPPPSAGRDFLRLAPHLMLPLGDLLRLRGADNRRILAMVGVGLLPLVLLVYLQNTRDLVGAIWGVALYSSILWALFFYSAFSQPQVTLLRCASSFLGSALFSIGLVALSRYVIRLEWVQQWTEAPNLGTRWAGHLVGVALIEETAKLFVLYFLWPLRLQPRVMMFYGLLAGLGFGIYEGVAYQSSANLRLSFSSGTVTPEGAATYYMLNVLRLTSLPFLHAMWTGIAGYFIGFAAQFPQRSGGLLWAALVVPVVLHATFNTFAGTLAGLVVAVVTVLALNLYIIKGRDFEAVVAGGARTEPPGGQ